MIRRPPRSTLVERRRQRQMCIRDRIKAFIPLMIPLFISAFQRADELAIAMEVRGYDANVQRTSYRKLSWHKRDTLSLFSLIPIGMILFVLKYMGV